MAKKTAKLDMNVTVNGTSYPLYIGFGFLTEIETLASQDFGGLEMALLGLMEEDPLTVKAVLTAALGTHDEVTTELIEQTIEQDLDIPKFCKDFLTLLESANLTKGKYKKMMPILKELVKMSNEEVKRLPKLMKQQLEKELKEASITTE